MTTQHFPRLASALAVTLLAAACGSNDAPNAAGQPVSPDLNLATTIAQAEQVAPAASADTERVQGTMRVDVGNGVQQLRSVATVVDPNAGAKAAARLGTAEGKEAVATMGQGRVSSQDVQDLANELAGRTLYSSQARHVTIIKQYLLSLDAKSPGAPGARVTLDLGLSDSDLSLQSAKVSYYPNDSKSFDSFEGDIPLSDITITKLERVDAQTFAIAGSFKAADLLPGVLSKKLKGQTLASISGDFDIVELPIRDL
jgi:hypothetical protein